MVSAPSRYELGVGAVGGVTAVAGSYAVAGYTPSFVVAPIDALVVKLTPGAIVAYMIQNVGAEAHLLHIALSAALAVALFGLCTLGGLWLADRTGTAAVGAAAVAALGWLAAVAITRQPMLSAGAAVPATVVTALGHHGFPAADHDPSRRQVIGAVAGTVAFVGGAVGLGSVSSEDEPLTEAPATDGVDDRMTEATTKSLDTAGDLPGLVSDIGGFYNVDIAEFEPELTREDWSVTFTGEIAEADMTVTFDDLLERPVEHRYVTLRCVGEDLNGRKLDNAVWTGTPIKPLLDAVDPEGDCGCVVLRGDDGYFVEYPVEVLESGFLAWGMNGKELPPAHGHPVRILIPGHWGETNVKWLTEIELLDEEMDGYWERRGWEGTGTVTTVAKLWDEGITDLGDGRTELAGHAYAGTRGVARVEVSTDGGTTWNEATLSEPLPAEDVWRQWRYTFEPSGTHEVVVRAVDQEGDVQPRERADSYPRGASGWVRRTVTA
jgi:DMSO/TMAO reductase YedYZ molybdopterin-dependent catalytic subunit